MEQIAFTHTTTIGLQRRFMAGTVLEREIIDLQTEYGPAQVKQISLDGGLRFYPEYESVKNICRSSGRSFQEVYQLLRAQAESAGAPQMSSGKGSL